MAREAAPYTAVHRRLQLQYRVGARPGYRSLSRYADHPVEPGYGQLGQTPAFHDHLGIQQQAGIDLSAVREPLNES